MRNNKAAKISLEGRVMFKRSGFSVCALAVTGALASSLTAQTPATTQAPAAPSTIPIDEIVAKHLATKGGAEKWKASKTQKMTGVAVFQGFQLP